MTSNSLSSAISFPSDRRKLPIIHGTAPRIVDGSGDPADCVFGSDAVAGALGENGEGDRTRWGIDQADVVRDGGDLARLIGHRSVRGKQPRDLVHAALPLHD